MCNPTKRHERRPASATAAQIIEEASVLLMEIGDPFMAIANGGDQPSPTSRWRFTVGWSGRFDSESYDTLQPAAERK